MSYVRTVLGDVPPERLGLCYAHEHIIIDGSVAADRYPDFRLDSVERAAGELRAFRDAGGRAMIDSMPCDAGRNVLKLAEVSRRTDVHIVAPTGLHLPGYYDSGHWSHRLTADRMARLFIADIVEGIDAHDYGCPMVERTAHRAGVIKIATGDAFTAREERIFEAAAEAHRMTGCPILTHCEAGRLALEQVERLRDQGVAIDKVVLSHTDRLPDAGYHREILASGVCLEYDSAFRWKNREDNPTADLLISLLLDFPHQLMLGMDAARTAYWRSYGGRPGLNFLITEFASLLRERGLEPTDWERLMIGNPARAYAFRQPPAASSGAPAKA